MEFLKNTSFNWPKEGDEPERELTPDDKMAAYFESSKRFESGNFEGGSFEKKPLSHKQKKR